MITAVKVYRVLSVALIIVTLAALMAPDDAVQASVHWLEQRWPWLFSILNSGFWTADKWVHLGLFALCGWSLMHAWYSAARGWALFYLVLLGVGLVTEVGQQFVPGRDADPIDLLADAMGAGLGVGLALLKRAATVSHSK